LHGLYDVRDAAADGAAGDAADVRRRVCQELPRSADLRIAADAGARNPDHAVVAPAVQDAAVDVCGAAAEPAGDHHALAAWRCRAHFGSGPELCLHDRRRTDRVRDHDADLPQRAPGDFGMMSAYFA